MCMTKIPQPRLVFDRLRALGTSPALTWYGERERIELSGKVCMNHLAKTVNFLRDEISLEKGGEVIMDLPLHWKSLLWSAAAFSCGAKLRFLGCEEDFLDLTDEQAVNPTEDTVIISGSAAHLEELYDLNLPAVLLALNTESLEPAWNADLLGPLPGVGEIIDAGAEVPSQPDLLTREPEDLSPAEESFTAAARGGYDLPPENETNEAHGTLLVSAARLHRRTSLPFCLGFFLRTVSAGQRAVFADCGEAQVARIAAEENAQILL